MQPTVPRRQSMSTAEQERDDLLKHYTAEHPTVRAAVARVERVRAHADAERRAIVVTLEKRLAAEGSRVRELEEAVEAAEKRVAEIGRKAVRLQLLKEESDTVGSSYKNVARRIEEVEVAIATGTRENNLFVIDEALTPKFAVRPRKSLNLLLGAIAAVVFGVVVCVVLEQLDMTIRSKDDAVRRIIANSPKTAATAQQLLEKLSPTVPVLLTNLVSLGQVALTYNAGMEQILVLMPGIIAAMQTMVNQGAKDQSATASFQVMNQKKTRMPAPVPARNSRRDSPWGTLGSRNSSSRYSS